MLSLLTVLNSIFQTYLGSLKRDFVEARFQTILIIALLSWAGLLIVLGLIVARKFQMPDDPYFYIFWFGVTLIAAITFTLFLLGMLRTSFFAANSLSNVDFAITAFYAALFLGEKYKPLQIWAIGITAAGVFLFFKIKKSEKLSDENKGLLYILVALILSPLGGIFYKSATLHASTYYQFLCGRLVMDAFFYTLFFAAVFLFWYKKNPLPQIADLAFSSTGLFYVLGSTVANLLDSWLIYEIPLSLFTILGVTSIPASYFIGRAKYADRLDLRHFLGSVLIILGVIIFAVYRR